ncbi:MdtP family multidrug efflux transporter outer membrane subunit [Paraburkholderia sp. JHI869]|uniref:MdtP family multidrug efflux transporter outer membrane subunit n=1 Tax=Paraburkholderia sp. JHI869 TaxID=3112959 RepID=UPI0031782349
MKAQRDPDRLKWRHLTVIAACVSCMVAGCALIHHNGQPDATIAPEQINLADDIHLAQEGWPAARWWTQYNDPQLDALIDQALSTAPTMHIARTRVSQARSDVELVSAGSSLQVTAIALLDRTHVSANGFLGPFAENIPAEGLTGPWYTTGLVGLGASLNIDIWGKQRAQVAAALGVNNARIAETSAVELEISADVAQLYYGIQTTYALIDLLKQSRDIAAFSVAAHEARVARGLESRTELEAAKALQLAIEEQLVSAQNRIVGYRESLRALIGAGPHDLPVITPAPLPTQQAALPATLSYELLARRPDLQALRWYVQASFSRIDAAKAAFYPSFDIRAFFGVNALHLADLFTHASQQINLIPGLTLPIFDGGLLNAHLGGERAQSNMLIDQYNEAVLNAVRDVAQAGSRLQALDTQFDLQRRKVESIAFAGDSAEAHYQRGLSSRLTALEARQPVIAEQVALLALRGEIIGQDITLTKALGGGYRAESPVELKPR